MVHNNTENMNIYMCIINRMCSTLVENGINFFVLFLFCYLTKIKTHNLSYQECKAIGPLVKISTCMISMKMKKKILGTQKMHFVTMLTYLIGSISQAYKVVRISCTLQ